MKNKFLSVLLLLLVVALAGCTTNTTPSDTSGQSETPDENDAVVSTAEMPKGIVEIDEWEEFYPDHVADFKATSEMSSTTYGGSEPYSYLEKYPYLSLFYDGYVYQYQFDRARGHIYAYNDIKNTARPIAGASCLACKVSEFNEDFNQNPSVGAEDFEEYDKENVTVPMTCYDCHGEMPGVIRVNRMHFINALDNSEYAHDKYKDKRSVACAQCHVEYYFTPDDLIPTLPWDKGLGADEAYEYYENIDFYDWEHPQTKAKLLKAQHPETETFDNSIHEINGVTCIDCHMPRTKADKEDSDRHSHHWTSPLKDVDNTCRSCHTDKTGEELIADAEAWQKPVVERTDEVGLKLEKMINLLSQATNEGSLSEAELEELRDMHRESQFYWDYVFVENSEGFHNSEKQLQYLDHAEEIIDEAMQKLNA